MWDSVPYRGPWLSLRLHFLICIESPATAASGEAGLGVTSATPEMTGPPPALLDRGWGGEHLLYQIVRTPEMPVRA